MVVQQYGDGGGARAVRALAAAGVIAVTAGCFGGDGGGGAGDGSGQRAVAAADRPLDLLGQAADVLVEAGGAETRTSMETAAGGTRVTIRGQGAYDFRKQMGRLRVVLPKDAAGKDAAGAGGHRPITELLAPGALYMKNRGAGVPDDKWVRIDTTGLKDGNLVTGGVTDPMAAAELLRGAADVTYSGKTELAGVTVHRYRGVADLGRAARAASPQSRGALSAAAKGFSKDAVPSCAPRTPPGSGTCPVPRAPRSPSSRCCARPAPQTRRTASPSSLRRWPNSWAPPAAWRRRPGRSWPRSEGACAARTAPTARSASTACSPNPW
ncbi:hypothetical protein [Streptomyces parvus]|uniref:hypothetical protein n=1 Tax=Streptomyces parvus TaxID=66428 RepID=UPI001FCBC9D9|nr:hypothetical protein [Streptomyces parvus]